MPSYCFLCSPYSNPFENDKQSLIAGAFNQGTFASSVKGTAVLYNVYLPPDWVEDATDSFPLLFFLYGQRGDENTFASHIDASQINKWINDGEIRSMVIISVLGDRDPSTIQWYTEDNEVLLTSEMNGEAMVDRSQAIAIHNHYNQTWRTL